MFDLMSNDSPQPTSFPPLASRQHEDSLMTYDTVPSGAMAQNIYPAVRTEHSTRDTARMDSMDGVVATYPLTTDAVMMGVQPSSRSQNIKDSVVATERSTTDTVMTDDQPSSKLSQNIKDDSLATDSSTTLATTNDELFADFLVDDVNDLLSPEPSTFQKLPYRVPYFPHSPHQQPEISTPAIPIFKRQKFIHLMTEEMVHWLTSLEPAQPKPAMKHALIDPDYLENARQTQDSFNRFLARYPHLRSTSQHYVSARHQFWRARGSKAELAPSLGAAELYAWEAAPDSVPAPSTAMTAHLKQAREMLAAKPDPRRGKPCIYSFNADNNARHNNAAAIMPPPPPPLPRRNPATATATATAIAAGAHIPIPRPIFGNLPPSLLPNSHIDNLRYDILNSSSESRGIVARCMGATDTETETETVFAALDLCARLAVVRVEFAGFWEMGE
ncbi:hypothetical protein BDV97DRAFT_402198 [Delphinella strobiligena]|nr:hypothetical protein BDV97DRAFT_402198 [Delphinella strobiligena]